MTTLTKAAIQLKPYFIANWSAFAALEKTTTVLDKLLSDIKFTGQQHFVAAQFATMVKLIAKYHDSGLIFGTDAMLDMSDGSFTGTIAARLIKEAQGAFALLGSCEPRPFKSARENIPKKIKAAIQADLTPFVCAGETLEEYDHGSSKQILTDQLQQALEGLTPHQLLNINIIYEAPWINAIPYKPDLEQLAEAYRTCREVLQEILSVQIADGLHLICAVPYDFDDLSSLLKASEANGFYLSNAVLHPNQLHRMFSKDLSLHGEFELPEMNAPLPQTPAKPAAEGALPAAAVTEEKPSAAKKVVEEEKVEEEQQEEEQHEEEQPEEEKALEAEAQESIAAPEAEKLEESSTEEDEYFEIVKKDEAAPAPFTAEEVSAELGEAPLQMTEETQEEIEPPEGKIPEEEEKEEELPPSEESGKKTIRVADITKHLEDKNK